MIGVEGDGFVRDFCDGDGNLFAVGELEDEMRAGFRL